MYLFEFAFVKARPCLVIHGVCFAAIECVMLGVMVCLCYGPASAL